MFLDYTHFENITMKFKMVFALTIFAILGLSPQTKAYNPHSAPQTVPEGNYGDKKSKLA
jgi:hypothetical protein